MQEILDAREAARRLRLSHSTLLKLLRERPDAAPRRLRYPVRRVLFTASAIDEYIQRHAGTEAGR